MVEGLCTGIIIPESKRNTFTMAFEDDLIYLHDCALLFGPLKKNSREVKLKYLKCTHSNALVEGFYLNKAKKYIQQHVEEVLYRDIAQKKKAEVTSTVTEVIRLDEENLPLKLPSSTIDLTDADSEIINLDETIIELDKTISELDLTIDSIVNKDSDVQIINVKQRKNALCDSGPIIQNGLDNEVQILCNKSKQRKIKDSKRRKQMFNKDNSTDNDIEMIQTPLIVSTRTRPPCVKLSEGAQKYYRTLNGVVSKNKKKKKSYDSLSIHHSSESTMKRKRRSMKNILKHPGKRRPDVFRKLVLNESPHISTTHKESTSRYIAINNTFNPNPLVIDVGGLRPIVIDGCNVAYGHGKGRFSVKGIKICVDYFHGRGHSEVKIILPMCYQRFFTPDIVADLKGKCQTIFTPSRLVNGIRKTPYDDRYIVQYADEFGGIIVSTDNYRDLLKENPKWRNTILNRLLMFTWVDDFLMFPVDPLGRKGPMLNEFLRF